MKPLGYLTPLAWIYGIVATFRARFYQAGYLPSHKLPGTTISVGILGVDQDTHAIEAIHFLRLGRKIPHGAGPS